MFSFGKNYQTRNAGRKKLRNVNLLHESLAHQFNSERITPIVYPMGKNDVIMENPFNSTRIYILNESKMKKVQTEKF